MHTLAITRSTCIQGIYKEKTAFMIEGANYYYEVMSFELKNVGATYQRLMDKVFRGLISRNVEVYVNDIVVKSDSCD